MVASLLAPAKSIYYRFKMSQLQYFKFFYISPTCWPYLTDKYGNHEEDLKQTRRDRPIFKKKVGNYEKCEFSNLFLFQRAKMIISVLAAWVIVDCNLAARVLISF